MEWNHAGNRWELKDARNSAELPTGHATHGSLLLSRTIILASFVAMVASSAAFGQPSLGKATSEELPTALDLTSLEQMALQRNPTVRTGRRANNNLSRGGPSGWLVSQSAGRLRRRSNRTARNRRRDAGHICGAGNCLGWQIAAEPPEICTRSSRGGNSAPASYLRRAYGLLRHACKIMCITFRL